MDLRDKTGNARQRGRCGTTREMRDNEGDAGQRGRCRTRRELWDKKADGEEVHIIKINTSNMITTARGNTSGDKIGAI